MTLLPSEIVNKIISYPFLNIYDKDNFLLNVYPCYIDLIKNEKLNIINNFYHYIIELLGGVNKMIHIPLLKFKSTFCKLDYIDNVHIQDVTNPIMIGIDFLGRPFVTILYKYKNNYNLEVIFQRYTHETYTWTSGTCYSKNIPCYGYFIDRGLIDYNTINKINIIFNNNYILDSD